MTALEELTVAYCSLSEDMIRYLNMLRSSHGSASAATAGTTPVTTGLLVFISGAAHGNNLPIIVQAIDSNVWEDGKQLARMIRDTLAKAKGKLEVRRLMTADDPRGVSASLNRELKDEYVRIPKHKKGEKKRAHVVAGTTGVPGLDAAQAPRAVVYDSDDPLDGDYGGGGRGGREPFGMAGGKSPFATLVKISVFLLSK